MYSQQYFKRVPDFSKNLAQDLCSTVKWHRTDVFYLRQCFLLLPANNIPKLMNQKIQLHLLKIIGFPPFSQKLNNSSTYKGTYMEPSVFSRISSIFYITYISRIPGRQILYGRIIWAYNILSGRIKCFIHLDKIFYSVGETFYTTG